MTHIITTDEETVRNTFSSLGDRIGARPVLVEQHHTGYLFLARPLLGPLLFENSDSDARDHCASFLSWLRLAVYMAIVSMAIVMSFHLKRQPSPMERRMALPLGLIFWGLALVCLALGFANYINAVTKYSRRQALVQTGWKTQLVSTIVAAAIVAVCILFLATDSQQAR
ncbi:MAG: hypothetical protein M1838_000773 [Thelocarpon superellum]|nr:MAG: hypothetical protein M1838_000773 [Thelocarpon superellum]